MSTVIALQSRTRYTTSGKTISITKNEKYSTNSIHYRTFGAMCFSVVNSTGSVTIPDQIVLDSILRFSDAGEQIPGNYKQVWYTLLADIQDHNNIDTVMFSQRRAQQISRCGRKYQDIVGENCFHLLCPDLQQTASDWVN